MAKTNRSSKKMLQFERYFIEFVDDNIKLGFKEYREWTSIEEQLWKLLNDKKSSAKIEFADFRGFPNIQVARLL